MKNWLLPLLALGGLGAFYMYSQDGGGEDLPSGEMTNPQGGKTATWEVKKDGESYFGYYQEDGDDEKVVVDEGGMPVPYDVPVKAAIAVKNLLGGRGYMQIGESASSGAAGSTFLNVARKATKEL